MIYRGLYPLFRFLISFITGVLIAFYTGRPSILPVIACSFFFILTCLLVFVFNRSLGYSQRWITGLVMTMLFVLFGYQLTLLSSGEKKHYDDTIRQFGQGCAIARINEPCSEKDKTLSTTLKLLAMGDTNIWKTDDRLVLASIFKDSNSVNLNCGDVIFFKAGMKELSKPANPQQFDYRKFMANKHIFYQVYIPSSSWRIMKTDDGHGIRYFAIALREKIKSIFQSMQLGGDEYSVVTALLIGARDELDKGLWEEFKSAGVLHILCVSGMHVGLIYVVLSFLFSFMNRKHGLKIVRTILIIALIWLYALVTGMGPSVLRAATMFSFVTVGTTLQRMTGIYNTLIASALVLLVLNPFLLRDAGFQLSYAAVIGIVTLQKPLNRLLSVKWWLPARMWAITTVTLAAQIATFPLSLLYFHQFPVFFIPANMIVLPLSTLIIYTALVCLMLSPLAFITPLLSWILAFITHLMIGAVDMIDGLPGAVIRPIAMDAVCCILLYGVVIAAWKFIGSKKYVALFTGLLFILSIGALSLLRKTCQEQQHKIIVYSIPRQSAYDFIDGRNHLFFADSSLISDARKQDFYVRQGWTAMGLNRAENFTIEALSQQPLHQTSVFYQNRNFIQLEDIRIVILDRTFSRNMPVTPPVHVDIIIISNGAGISPGEIAGKFPAGHVIIDSSCDQWKVKRNLAGIDTLKAHLHRVSEEGSFIFEW